MSSEDVLFRVSDIYQQEWDKETMFKLVCEFIDVCGQEPALADWLENKAKGDITIPTNPKDIN